MHRAVILLLVLPFAAPLHAAEEHNTVVIYSGTNTIAAAPYLRHIERAEAKRDDALDQAKALLDAADFDPNAVSLAAFFPFHSEQLRPGEPTQKSVEKLTSPLFVIGMDSKSLQWLDASFEQLKALGAQGLVVEAENYDAYDALRRKALARGVLIDVAPGDALAEGFGIHSYPVLLVAE